MASSSFLHLLAILVCCYSLVLTASAESSSSSKKSCSSNNNKNIFGVATTTTTLVATTLRGGGAVEDCASLDDLDAALIRAGGETLVVIDFSATWCGPCKVIGPIFEEMASQSNGEAVFLKVDVDENPDAAAKYAVSAMPTFVFLKRGEVVDRLMGANPTRLQELINQHK